MDELIVALSGAIGQVVGTFCIFPLDVLKTRMQAAKKVVNSNDDNENNKNQGQIIKHLQKMYMNEGLLGIYKLFPAKALALSISRFTYYFWYRFNTNQCKYFLNIKQLNTLQNITCGYLAGIFNTIFISPVEKIQVRVLAASKDTQDNTIIKHVKDIYEENGWYSFYFGWKANFYTSATPAISNTVFDQIKMILLNGRNALGYFEAFFLGAFSKAIATFITFPVSRAKTILQNSKNQKNDKNTTSTSVYQLLSAMYQEQGLPGLYNGLQVTILNGVLREAVMLMVKERVDIAVRLAFGVAV